MKDTKDFHYETARQAAAARRKKARRARRRRRLIFSLLVLILLIAALCIGIVKVVNHFKVQPVEFFYTQQANGQYNVYEKVTRHFAVGVQYPVTGNAAVDAAISAGAVRLAEQYEQEQKDGRPADQELRPVCTISSEISSYPEYVCVLYHIVRDFPEEKIREERTLGEIYGQKEGRQITLDEIFGDAGLKYLSDYTISWFKGQDAYQEQTATDRFILGTQERWENFDGLWFQEQNLTIFFDAGQLFDEAVQVTLPVGKLYEMMSYNITGYDPSTMRYVDPEKPMVALTFDDGPYPPVTNRILDALENVGGRATFFVLGERAKDELDVLHRMDEIGCQVGNHSYNHPYYTKMSADEINKQLSDTDTYVEQATGEKTAILRAPGAKVNDAVRAAVDRPFVDWSIDTFDWKTRKADCVHQAVMDHVSDGDIILMHDIYKSTAEAAEKIIPELAERGFQLVTVQELMEARGIAMEAGKTYHKAPPN